MHRTYELYFQHPDGREEFRPLTHRGDQAGVMRQVQALLDASPARSVDVLCGGAPLYTLLRT
jgi:hypothetical protein